VEKSTNPSTYDILSITETQTEGITEMNETITATLTRELALSILASLLDVAGEYGGDELWNDVNAFMEATGLTREDYENWL
jgi:hypothetical protein